MHLLSLRATFVHDTPATGRDTLQYTTLANLPWEEACEDTQQINVMFDAFRDICRGASATLAPWPSMPEISSRAEIL